MKRINCAQCNDPVQLFPWSASALQATFQAVTYVCFALRTQCDPSTSSPSLLPTCCAPGPACAGTEMRQASRWPPGTWHTAAPLSGPSGGSSPSAGPRQCCWAHTPGSEHEHCVCVCVCVYVCVRACVCACVCVRACVRVCVYMHLHACTCTYMYVHMCTCCGWRVLCYMGAVCHVYMYMLHVHG